MTRDAAWYPVALASDIEAGTSAGTRLFGQEIVVWRDESGAVHVWEDRCPHRGMRLSFGFVRGSHIACLYHGWRFDAAGQCRFIPAHPQLEVPASITVTRYASTERLGVIWACLADAAQAGAPPGGNAEAVPVRSLAMRASAAHVTAALLGGQPPFRQGGAQAAQQDGPLVTITAEVDTLFAAVQPVADEQAMVHLGLAGTGDPEDRKRASRWAEALRRSIEAEVAPRPSVIA